MHWPFEYVDELGLDQVKLLMSYWNKHGAIHDMVRLKWFTPRKSGPQINSTNFIDAAKELGIG